MRIVIIDRSAFLENETDIPSDIEDARINHSQSSCNDFATVAFAESSRRLKKLARDRLMSNT